MVAWASEQARLIRAGRFDLLDREHIAEEIEDVGKSEQRELATRMAVLLAHLLKWQHQPERRGASWEVTISSQRQRIVRRLDKTPSLRGCLNDPDWWADAWGDAWSSLAIQHDRRHPHHPTAPHSVARFHRGLPLPSPMGNGVGACLSRCPSRRWPDRRRFYLCKRLPCDLPDFRKDGVSSQSC